MHAIVVGLIGALLGAALGRFGFRPSLLRWVVLATTSTLGVAGVLILNTVLAERYLPELYSNPTLGAGVLLLGLYYLERRCRRMLGHTATSRESMAAHPRPAGGMER